MTSGAGEGRSARDMSSRGRPRRDGLPAAGAPHAPDRPRRAGDDPVHAEGTFAPTSIGRALLGVVVALVLTACAPRAPSEVPPVLLFRGTGTSANDVAAVEMILQRARLEYAAVDSSELNRMSVAELMAHRLVIVPGGNFITIGENLTPDATANVRTAVQGGVNYLGICAGGLLAGDAAGNSLDLTSGVRFGFYAAVERGVHKAVVTIGGGDGAAVAGGASALEQYWEDGPEFTGWGAVVGTYPDGTPAIVEGTCGKGWVVLCGFHPEAPESWRRGMTFTTPASVCNAYAAALVEAALNRTPLAGR